MKHVAVTALSILLAVSGCSKKAAPAAPEASPPPPAALIASVGLPSLDGALAGVRTFAEALQPGLGALIVERQLLAEAGVGTLDGAAGDRPAHVLLVDPRAHTAPVALLVAVADSAKLQASVTAAGAALRELGGHAVVGNKAVVALIGDWALTTLATTPAPTVPTATGYSPALLATYRDDIEQGAAQLKATMTATGNSPGMAEIADYYARGAIGLLEGSQRLEVRLEADAGGVALDLGVVGVPGSAMATFIAAQQPSDFALLERLPAGSSSAVLVGKMLLGALRNDALALLETFLIRVYGVPASGEVRALMAAWADSATGDMAASIEFAPGRMRMTQLVGADNPTQVHTAAGAFFAKWAQKPIEVTQLGTTSRFSATPSALVVDGVTFHRYTSETDTSTLPPEQAKAATALGTTFVGFIGAWDDVMGVAMGDPESARRLVAASRGKGPRLALSPRVSADLAAARARKDSYYYFIDFGTVMAALGPATGMPAFSGSLGLAMTLGFADGAGRLRFAVTTADVKGVMAASAAAGGQ